MTEPPIPFKPEPPEVLAELGRMFREYFDRAEERRRWSLVDDVPWEAVNHSMTPAVADVVETFCAVELYLPDYVSKLISQVRESRGRAWFFANWGYEESKHSLVLEDWLLRSESRTDEQMTDLHARTVDYPWELPQDSARGMLCYAMFQELATQLHYVRLRTVVRQEGGCPALEKILSLVATDEAAHADFFFRAVRLYLEFDREGTLEQLRRVANSFKMPATYLLADGKRRVQDVIKLDIFNDEIWFHHVLEPALSRLGLTRHDLRRKVRREVSTPSD